MLTIANHPSRETDPRVIVRTSRIGAPLYTCELRTYNGTLSRVSPSNGEDVELIKMLRHGIDYFAPATGNGLLVNPKLLER